MWLSTNERGKSLLEEDEFEGGGDWKALKSSLGGRRAPGFEGGTAVISWIGEEARCGGERRESKNKGEFWVSQATFHFMGRPPVEPATRHCTDKGYIRLSTDSQRGTDENYESFLRIFCRWYFRFPFKINPNKPQRTAQTEVRTSGSLKSFTTLVPVSSEVDSPWSSRSLPMSYLGALRIFTC
jgi:hypothetical protein